jgi:hypothetical protein
MGGSQKEEQPEHLINIFSGHAETLLNAFLFDAQSRGFTISLQRGSDGHAVNALDE